jgi:cysteine-rich repeat protein
MRERLAVTLLVVLACGTPVLAKELRCLGGRFQIRRSAHYETVLPAGDLLIDDQGVSIERLCPAVSGTVHASPRGTRVLAEWPSCGGRRVRLRGVIDRICRRLWGVIQVSGRKPRRLRALRIPECGDGFREAVEQCDDGNTRDGDCCSATCEREAGCPACTTNGDCPAGSYCARPQGPCEGEGACAARPEGCLAIVDQVCGCDGNTYGNPCEAAQAGVGVASVLACPRRCGTIVGIECPEGQFCDFPAGMCHAADLGGICLFIPTSCPRNYDPVCGCDGETYPNECVRRVKQAHLDHTGPCSLLTTPSSVSTATTVSTTSSTLSGSCDLHNGHPPACGGECPTGQVCLGVTVETPRGPRGACECRSAEQECGIGEDVCAEGLCRSPFAFCEASAMGCLCFSTFE